MPGARRRTARVAPGDDGVLVAHGTLIRLLLGSLTGTAMPRIHHGAVSLLASEPRPTDWSATPGAGPRWQVLDVDRVPVVADEPASLVGDGISRG